MTGRLRILRVLSDTTLPSRRALSGARTGGPCDAQEPEPQVSWKAIERDAAVVGADGAEIARVVEIAGDRTADIFSGLVVKLGVLDTKRSFPAEHVVGIWPQRVQVDLTAEEVEALPPYEEPVVERLPAEGLLQPAAPPSLPLILRARRSWSGTRGKTTTSRA